LGRFSPDGRWLASIHIDECLINPRYAICLWEITAANKLGRSQVLPPPKNCDAFIYKESLQYLCFSPNGEMLAARFPGDCTMVWGTKSGNARLQIDNQGLVVSFARDGHALVLVTRDGLVQHCDIATGKCAAPTGQARRKDFVFVEDARPWADGKTLALTDGNFVVLKDALSGMTFRRLDTRTCALTPKESVERAWRRDGDFLWDRSTGTKVAHLDSGLNETPQTVTHDNAVASESGHGPEVRPPHLPKQTLEARLTSRKSQYTIDLAGKSAEAFAKEIYVAPSHRELPPSPKVDLLLTLRNTGTEVLSFDPARVHVEIHVVGDGAMNHPMESFQTGYIRGAERHETTLAPGEVYTLPIKSLDFDHCRQSYWLLPGVYSLQATGYLSVSPPPKEATKMPSGSGWLDLDVPPLRVRVVERGK
jgi:hypothetical protein